MVENVKRCTAAVHFLQVALDNYEMHLRPPALAVPIRQHFAVVGTQYQLYCDLKQINKTVLWLRYNTNLMDSVKANAYKVGLSLPCKIGCHTVALKMSFYITSCGLN